VLRALDETVHSFNGVFLAEAALLVPMIVAFDPARKKDRQMADPRHTLEEQEY